MSTNRKHLTWAEGVQDNESIPKIENLVLPFPHANPKGVKRLISDIMKEIIYSQPDSWEELRNIIAGLKTVTQIVTDQESGWQNENKND